MPAATIETIESCGVVGAGGAGFPTHVKLKAKAGIIILNAAECEPLLHKDKEMLRAFADEARHRAALNGGQRTLAEIATREDLELACDLLVPFAHWITPVFMPKRFDTWFFLVAAPPDQVALHDGHESVDSVWLTPADAEAARSAGQRTIIFPTLLNVRKLGRAKTVADAFANARSEPIVTVLPRVEKRGETPVMVLPADAGYDVVEAPLAEVS